MQMAPTSARFTGSIIIIDSLKWTLSRMMKLETPLFGALQEMLEDLILI